MPKNEVPIYIIADDREQKAEVIRSLSGIENVDVQIRRLSIGDYQVDDRVIVERKKLKDFAISIIDGRLFKQMMRLANSTLRPLLNAPFCSISASGSNFNPRNTKCIPVVKILVFLELEQN